MGRELKRVSLDFSWPLETVWDGYINPHYHPCPVCHGRGNTSAAKRLGEIVSLLLIAGEESLRQHLPSPEMATLTTGLAGRSPAGRLGHDSIDHWHATKAIILAAGCDPNTWGRCVVCGGEGIDPVHKANYEAWTKVDPPAGEGYQVWETVTEGSPISPVFSTDGTCIAWLIDQGYSATAAHNFVAHGWAPSAVMVNGVMYRDIESAAIQNVPDAPGGA